ncbi:hypothetical protein BX265_0184 [Streptomyces sp. TLI_235]|nr:hypothetical protein BX265_0184 [Streptomyces sp. TLI_235]
MERCGRALLVDCWGERTVRVRSLPARRSAGWRRSAPSGWTFIDGALVIDAADGAPWLSQDVLDTVTLLGPALGQDLARRRRGDEETPRWASACSRGAAVIPPRPVRMPVAEAALGLAGGMRRSRPGAFRRGFDGAVIRTPPQPMRVRVRMPVSWFVQTVPTGLWSWPRKVWAALILHPDRREGVAGGVCLDGDPRGLAAGGVYRPDMA